MSTVYIGGIEGGATHSKVVICNEEGAILSTVTGPGTNHWVIGIPGVAARISEMINRAKTEANIPHKTKLLTLGLSLSGCEQEATNKVLENELLTNYPDVSESYYVCSDTIGSVFTASPLGGLVLIAGTGSNALLRNPDGKTYNCGGWGNFLADEGSAWWISHKAIKTVFDDADNLVKSPYDTSAVWAQIKKHFSIKTRHDLLDHCYANFDKAFFASLCAKLSEAADAGDQLSLHLFEEAGRFLAKATVALLPHVSEKLIQNGDFNVLCVGSVWKSWHLLKHGYSKEIAQSATLPFGLNLLRLTQAMAIGAAYIAADSIKFNLPRNYSHNYEIFHHYQKTESSVPKTNGLVNGIDSLAPTKNTTNGATTTTCPQSIAV